MLLHLSIQNFAIIDELTVDFQQGLNIITGETGAGKSILLGALGLVLGNRADSSALRAPDKKCIVEATFSSNKKQLQQWLTQNEIDIEEELILRREIAATGKSRAFINDTPVTLTQLKELTAALVDLHQQFDTLELGEEDFQREVIDALAGCTETVEHYRTQYLSFARLQKELEQLKQQQLQQQKEQDYKQFLLDELEQASFKENELEEAEQELKLLNSAESIAAVLTDSVSFLKDGETPVVQQLKIVLQRLQQYKDVHPDISNISQRLLSAQIELSDIASELDHLQNSISIDEARMQQLNERMEIGYKLQKKHGLHSTNELLALQQQLENELQAVADADNTIAAKEKEAEQLKLQLEKEAKAIHQLRSKQTEPFVKQVNALLARVGMPNAQLKVELTTGALQPYGIDKINFLFDANKSNRFEPISKVASGGELSRLMLCIKSLVAERISLSTMLFDEIDTGISGEAAKQVGILLKELANRQQVITITHLPQIAAKAEAHYFVYKQDEQSVIKTKIRRLTKDEQIEAVAKMLSGEKPTDSSLVTAREMVTG
ncbi:DNA repair protein RecN (Recombination protein N) [Lacibacter cauensis]|uniref:DNA repair protein RecN n=1 Tax=Lacibacter cauensis TaxID=510947 RepID=A0A562SCX3_9BACT|nr:DNA repair protein RecN [Lacibacter cauensis]TWI79195.1 DNA repair protein RecN (Recombination protein N) [Lacibacter cauensis]